MEQIMNQSETQTLKKLLQEATDHLAATVKTFEAADFNRIPFEGSWSAAQVSEHLLKSMALIHHMVNDTTAPTLRDMKEHVPYLREIMEDMKTKAQSSPELLPGDQPINQQDILEQLAQHRDNILEDIHDLDLSETCTSGEFPGIGYITRLELISFAAFHTGRHIRQMENIYKILTGGNL